MEHPEKFTLEAEFQEGFIVVDLTRFKYGQTNKRQCFMKIIHLKIYFLTKQVEIQKRHRTNKKVKNHATQLIRYT